MNKAKIHFSISESLRAVKVLYEQMDFIEGTAQALSECFIQGNKVLIAGNGGSLCDAAHFAEELTGFFRKYRPALPVMALADPSHITCVANDVDFTSIFSRSVEAFGKEGDIFIGLSTSGNSANIIKAFQTAKFQKMKTIAFLGKNGGKLRGFADYEMLIEGFETSDRIQEAHMTALHIIVEMIEYRLFESKQASNTILAEKPTQIENFVF